MGNEMGGMGSQMSAGTSMGQIMGGMEAGSMDYGSNSQMGGMMGGMDGGAYMNNTGGMHSGGGGMGDMSSAMVPSASSQKGEGSDDGGRNGKIFVGGLPRNCSQDQLLNWASQFGGVISSEVKCDADGTPRGFGFVAFQDHAVAEQLVANGGRHQMDGKMISCKPHASWAGDTESSAESWGSPWGDGGTTLSSPKLFVGALPKTTTDETLKMHFSTFGTVTDIMVKKNPEGNCAGFGFVTFEDAASAQKVLDNYDDNMFEGKWIDCKTADNKGGKGGGKDAKMGMMMGMMGMMSMMMMSKGGWGKGKGGGGKGAKSKGPY